MSDQAIDGNSPIGGIVHRLRFTGSGRAYFSIWIVNLLLSILTLGIYSPWAKVRREQYFHRNVLLDEQGFDYTGDPRAILKGRVLALIVIFCGSFAQNVEPRLALAVTIAFALLYPWVIVRSLKFRARNTRYRNLAFRFSGTTLGAVKAYAWIYAAALPFVAFSAYYGAQLQSVEAAPAAIDKAQLERIQQHMLLAMLASFLLVLALWPVFMCRFKALLHGNLHYGNARGSFDARVAAFYRVLGRVALVAVVAVVLMIGANAAVAGLAVATGLPALGVMGVLFMIPLMYLPQSAYVTGLTNTTYAHAAIGEQRFVSDMKLLPYAWVLVSTLVLLLLSCGLAWPWAVVRIARYRLEHLAVVTTREGFDAIVGQPQVEESAFGEEVADFLDFDISL